MEQITDNVHVETGYRGCNPGFVVTSDGVVMIDTPQRPTDALSYRSEIERWGKISYLINTEPHGDHYTGNCFFSTICVAHQGTREVIEKASLDQIKERIRLIDPDYAPNLDTYSLLLPEITFKESMKLHVGNHEFELIHLPGHTASETAVFIPQERVVFSGDNIFYKVQTFLHEALPSEWLDSLERLKLLEADIVVPGHGEVCSREYIDEQASFIRDWISSVKEAVSKGWSMAEAQNRISFLDRYPMGMGMEEFGPELQKMNVARLYTMAEAEQL